MRVLLVVSHHSLAGAIQPVACTVQLHVLQLVSACLGCCCRLQLNPGQSTSRCADETYRCCSSFDPGAPPPAFRLEGRDSFLLADDWTALHSQEFEGGWPEHLPAQPHVRQPATMSASHPECISDLLPGLPSAPVCTPPAEVNGGWQAVVSQNHPVSTCQGSQQGAASMGCTASPSLRSSDHQRLCMLLQRSSLKLEGRPLSGT